VAAAANAAAAADPDAAATAAAAAAAALGAGAGAVGFGSSPSRPRGLVLGVERGADRNSSRASGCAAICCASVGGSAPFPRSRPVAAAGAAPAGHESDGSMAPAMALGLLPGRRWRSAAGASVGVEMPCRIAADCGGASNSNASTCSIAPDEWPRWRSSWKPVVLSRSACGRATCTDAVRGGSSSEFLLFLSVSELLLFLSVFRLPGNPAEDSNCLS
jgi:hypothetical protein